MKKIIVFALLSVLALPVFALQPLPDPGVSTIDQLIEKIYRVMDVVFTILIIFAVGFILYAGFTYVTAAGDKDKTDKANKMIIYAAVGVLIAIFAKAIPTVVANILQ
ncbi:MAG: hypothetical protein AB1721_02240 [Patescibacteria group bacterium]